MSREQVTIGAVVDVKASVTSLKDLKGIIDDAKIALEGLDSDSKDYKTTLETLAQAQGEYNKVLEATKDSQKNMSSTIEGITNVTNGMMGGFQALNGVLALTGAENKNLVETLVKLKAVSSVVQGFKQFTDVIKAGNVAFKLFNITVKSNPLMLLATSIITVIALVKEFTSSLDEANIGLDDLDKDINFSVKGTTSIAKTKADEINKMYDFEIQKAKEAGKSKQELSLIEASRIKDLRKLYIDSLKAVDEEANNSLLELSNDSDLFISSYSEYYDNFMNHRKYIIDAMEKAMTGDQKKMYQTLLDNLTESYANVDLGSIQNIIGALYGNNEKSADEISKVKDIITSKDKGFTEELRSELKDSFIIFEKQVRQKEQLNKELSEIDDNYSKKRELNKIKEETQAKEQAKKEKERYIKEAKAKANALEEDRIYNEKKLDTNKKSYKKIYDTGLDTIRDLQENERNYRLESAKEYLQSLKTNLESEVEFNKSLYNQIDKYKTNAEEYEKEGNLIDANKEMEKAIEMQAKYNDKKTKEYGLKAEIYALEQERDYVNKENALQMSAIEKDKLDAKEAARQAGLDYQDMDTQLEQFELEQTINQAKAEMFLKLANDEKTSWEIRAEAIQSYDEYNQKSLQAFINAEKTKKQLSDRRKQIEKSAFNSTRTITYNTMDILNESIGNSKAGAIAKTTIDTYASATEAYRSQLPLGPKGPILGGLAAAAAITAGLKNVKSILKTKTPGNKGGGGSGGGIEQPDYLDNNPQITEQFVKMTSDDIDEINKSSRVYVVESDISETQNRVRTTEDQSTF